MTHDDGGPPPGVARGTAHLRVFQPLAASLSLIHI